MCGICGFYSNKDENISNLIEMNNSMSHRGPDDHGEEIYSCYKSNYCVGLAHRRLSIMDISKLGHQPMHSEDNRISVIFNGEIYNFNEIKKEIPEYTFKSTCDTEVIIASYLKWGIKCVEHFNGMFSIAIYDRKDEAIYLVRDRIGKKPLYYYLIENCIYFSSELKALMINKNFKKKINEHILSKYLYRQYINAPDSIFENTYKLEPGGILVFKQGKLKKWKYWDVAEQFNNLHYDKSYDEAKFDFECLIRDAVKMRLVADVPVGAFLSGGYDSALICAMAQRMTDNPLRTYSIGFEDNFLDEAPFAKKIANYLGTEHTEYYISENDMFGLVDSIPQYYDEPFADSSQICTMLVSELAKKDVTVVLTGDGGDEFFGGYSIYGKVASAQQKEQLGKLVHYFYKLPFANRIKDYKTLSFPMKIASETMDSRMRTQSGTSYYFERLNNLLLCKNQIVCLDPIEDRYNDNNWTYRRMLTDMETYLPGDILHKVDRATMKYSLEARCPFLDKEIMEFSLSLPLDYKIRNDILKKLVKDVTYKYIPKELMDRPKQGFAVPRGRWLRNELKEKLLYFTSHDFISRQNIFDEREIQRFVYDYIQNGNRGQRTGYNHEAYVWAYYVFQGWYERFYLTQGK